MTSKYLMLKYITHITLYLFAPIGCLLFDIVEPNHLLCNIFTVSLVSIFQQACDIVFIQTLTVIISIINNIYERSARFHFSFQSYPTGH